MPKITHELTAEDRAAALAKAQQVRAKRVELKNDLKCGNISINDFMCSPDAERIPVKQMLESMPGIGKAKANKIMRKFDIHESRRVRGLGNRQRTALIEYFS